MIIFLTRIINKLSFWNLFIGAVVGFGLGVAFMNELIPNANEAIRMYRLDKKSVSEDNLLRKDNLQGSIEINGN